ncbi:FkbM family methyltransferase [Spirosoma sp. HMF4905]|uniref:FkbM family methyltransferase n=1 Tax=Spirosoma arboris TaxID=2682092 RepID=A0A7K1SC24_9BACT|nr:FkbM family methyltransferase [Spirosoma arboris]MVM31116.1 FkbM family methyltransferase [Spirosoma arboris]
MSKKLVDYIKSVFSFFGLFVARRYPNAVNGHELAYDLNVIIRNDNPVCFDIGANRGQTIQLLQDCFRDPIIHSFEPSSATFATLASQSFGSRVQLHQLALGEQTGVAEFRNYTQSELSSFLPMNADKSENIFAEEELILTESVQVDTLDSFCSAQGIEQIDLLKIDTQGFELPVLRGGVDLFKKKRIRAVLLELNFSSLYEGQSDSLEILALMRTHNMRLVDYYEKERARGLELSWTTALFMRYS